MPQRHISDKPSRISQSPPQTSPLPKGWPANFPYLRTLTYSSTVLPTRLVVPRTCLPPTDTIPIIVPNPPAPAPNVRITPILDPAHPAHGQHGLFATRRLASDSLVVLYLGRAHTDAESDPASDYDVRLVGAEDDGGGDGGGISVDAAREGNEARFVNDYRGVRREGPNAEFRDVWVEGAVGGMVERRIGVFVLAAGKKAGRRERGIEKGEEVVVSYGKGFWRERGMMAGGFDEKVGGEV
ncbi:MAG: hypothetical protein M1821_004529 [Bathelium mastoideum]|nr:MAG: hypothetical protein M1821_004529 [Bathelium mastoideum]